jgi:hypothetical protein
MQPLILPTELFRSTQMIDILRWLSSGDRPDDGGSKDLWNVGKLLPDYTALQPRRQQSSYSPPWEPQILLWLTYWYTVFVSLIICVSLFVSFLLSSLCCYVFLLFSVYYHAFSAPWHYFPSFFVSFSVFVLLWDLLISLFLKNLGLYLQIFLLKPWK